MTPRRRCVGCGRAFEQRELLRPARAGDGCVRPDPRRRGGGRGAYVCAAAGCRSAVAQDGRLGRAFRAPAKLDHEHRSETPARGAQSDRRSDK
ncbi:MAG: YlxR family protein, partial [Thermoleophilaceae bacterium]